MFRYSSEYYNYISGNISIGTVLKKERPEIHSIAGIDDMGLNVEPYKQFKAALLASYGTYIANFDELEEDNSVLSWPHICISSAGSLAMRICSRRGYRSGEGYR